MFAIVLDRGHEQADRDGAIGKITLGSFTESFPVSVCYQQLSALEKAWHTELERLVAGADCVALRTSDRFLWCLYRSGEDVLVQQLLITDDWEGCLDARGNILALPARQTISEDGDPISEWRVEVADVREFLRGVAA